MIDYHNLTPEQEEEMIQSEFKALLRDMPQPHINKKSKLSPKHSNLPTKRMVE
jgi:hypothetical protein